MHDYTEAIKLYGSGLSVDKIAKIYGVSRESLWQSFKLRGVKMRKGFLYGRESRFYRGGPTNRPSVNSMARNAIKAGQLIKKPCEVCGKPDSIEAHHDDYNKPLEVRWLCSKHHFEWHQNNKAIPLIGKLPRSAYRPRTGISTKEASARANKAYLASMTPEMMAIKMAKMRALRWPKKPVEQVLV